MYGRAVAAKLTIGIGSADRALPSAVTDDRAGLGVGLPGVDRGDRGPVAQPRVIRREGETVAARGP